GEVALVQVPAARADKQRRHLVVQPVLLLSGVELDLTAHGIPDVALAVEHVAPRRRVRVFEVRHENPRARVEGVDHHLALDRAGDLAPPVAKVGRRLRNPPLPLTHVLRLGEEPRQLTTVQGALPLLPPLEQVEAGRVQLAVQERDELACLLAEDLLSHERDHAANWASSVDPFSASVDESGDTAWVTRSK